jgi:hypothetical protein
MFTWSIVRQWLGKHISATTDTQATIKDIDENDVSCEVCANALERV